MRLLVPALLFGLLLPASAQAHQKSVSYSKWTLLQDGAIAELRVRMLELTSIPTAADADASFDRSSVLSYLQSRLSLGTEGGPCEPIPSSATWLPAERGWIRIEWRCIERAIRRESSLAQPEAKWRSTQWARRGRSRSPR